MSSNKQDQGKENSFGIASRNLKNKIESLTVLFYLYGCLIII